MEDSLTVKSLPFPWTNSIGGVPAGDSRSPRIAVELAARLVNARRSSLLLPTRDNSGLRLAAATGMSDIAADLIQVRLGEPIAGVVAESGRPILVNERRARLVTRTRGYLTGSYISVPVPLNNSARGVLSVADPQRDARFDPDDLQALEGLAQQVSASLWCDEASHRIDLLDRTVHQLRRQVIQVQESERQRIARDLHDEAGHALTAAILRLDAEIAQRAGDVAALNTLQKSREELVSCAKSLHEIAFNLRPRILEDFGLHAAVRSLARYTMGLSDIEVSVEITGEDWRLNELDELAILRAVQESLTNARKYSQASTVSILLQYEPDYVLLHVEDNGVGLTGAPASNSGYDGRVSLGISGMRERIQLLGGKFWIGRGPAGGTLVSAMLPRQSV